MKLLEISSGLPETEAIVFHGVMLLAMFVSFYIFVLIIDKLEETKNQ